jgi:sterol desaturase/sphingolipid hydroxylase (fatty acid hydroxylase superfamily)
MRDLLRRVTQSRANYGAAYVVDVACPIVLALIGWGAKSSWTEVFSSLCAGAFVFSFVEYAIHRWLFHAPDSVMGAMHQAHHDQPRGHTALPFITSAAVASTCWLALEPLTGRAVASFFLCGLLGGYAWYSVLHHLEHSVRIRAIPFRWLQRRCAEHFVHHHLEDTNFGVTTAFWDHVFATHYRHSSRNARTGGPGPSASNQLRQ